MEQTCSCSHCGKAFTPNPRVKNQRYCSGAECQAVRKSLWQKQTLRADLDYKGNQSAAQQEWRKRHPDYWRNYRKTHPGYTERNRALQRERNQKARDTQEPGWPRGDAIAKADSSVIAKMDALTGVKSGTYRLIPVVPGVIAKMDALLVQLSVLPSGYEMASDCKDRTR